MNVINFREKAVNIAAEMKALFSIFLFILIKRLKCA